MVRLDVSIIRIQKYETSDLKLDLLSYNCENILQHNYGKIITVAFPNIAVIGWNIAAAILSIGVICVFITIHIDNR